MGLPDPYYESNGITIYHGDCMEIMPLLGVVDHVITDPPYSAQTHAGARTLANLDSRPVDFASITPEALYEAFDEMGRHVRRWVIATVDYHHIPALETMGGPDRATPLRWVRHGVWVKPDGAPQFSGDRPAQGWEAVAILHSSAGAPRWNGGGARAVWQVGVERGVAHPTAKPLALLRKWIDQFTDQYDLILDPYMGSGTTLRAAKDLGRHAIGIEVDEAYCALAADRMRQGVLL